MVNKDYITIPKLAQLLGISRIAVYRKVKSGEISATRIGRIYVISARDVSRILRKRLSDKDKSEIKKAVKKTIAEYGEVLKWLSKE